jgi:hypothetical protein
MTSANAVHSSNVRARIAFVPSREDGGTLGYVRPARIDLDQQTLPTMLAVLEPNRDGGGRGVSPMVARGVPASR